MVTHVSRNPRLVCRVNAVPTYSRGASSLTAAENCAESATIVTPQRTSSGASSVSGLPNNVPTTSAQHPDTAMAALVMRVRPQRSAPAPPSQQPTAPLATTTNVASAGTVPATASLPSRARSLCVTNTASHVHIAYSSHM